MESVSFIQWCLENLNYWTVTVLMTIESSFIPFPSEIIIPPAAYKAASGELNLWLVILSGTVGADIGALINYGLSIWIGRPLVLKFADSRIGHILMLNEEKITAAETYFRKRGAISTLIGRLLPAIRQLISIPAGLARMKLSSFLIYTTIGAGIWNTILAAMGYYMHSVVPRDRLISTVTRYSREISHIFLGIVLISVTCIILKKRRKKNTSI